ncbi:MAG: hypothetical protein FWD85_06045 [Microbacteriaceae bacterium]|nr:hypothetical protein [Microbacteriaceae bacterium]MCL2794853.1 hypothetical protein [Microbacteriaceae bacterium]
MRSAGASPVSAVEKAQADLERIRELKSRISGMERTRLASRAVPTLPAFASLLPGGALQAGGIYSVAGSMTLLMGLLSAASASGAWGGVVGVPEFGAEAASRFGIELARLVLVREPGDAWLPVTAALADALAIVVARPGARVSDAEAAKLAARLRQRGAVLISFGSLWPGSEAVLAVTGSRWSGMGRGHGYPRERLVTVRSEVRGGRARVAQLRVPGVAAPLDGVAEARPETSVPALRLERVS